MQRLILAGGGHGHINILKHLIKDPMDDMDITLITDNRRQYYSGMLAGFIEGIYTEDEISFNVPALCKRARVSYVEEKIIAIDGDEKRVITRSDSFDFDFISINLGSAADVTFPIHSNDTTLVKPIGKVVAAKEYLVNHLDKQSPDYKLAFTGGGAAGVELAIAFREVFPHAEIFIITLADILTNFNKKGRSKLLKILAEKNIKIIKNERVVRIDYKIIITDKNTYSFDHAFITTGVKGVDVDYIGYETSAKNELIVNDNLFANPYTLAMGDAVKIDKYPNMPKAGVFAIREAPILYDNMRKFGKENVSFCHYEPQLKYLQIINCGNKKALANYANFANHSRIAWKIKDLIDRDYMKIK